MGEYFNENLRLAREQKGLSQKIADVLDVSADELLGIEPEPTTLAAHFDGDEYTEDELNEIRQFAEFVKNRRQES